MTDPRLWPNQCANVRNDIAELVAHEIEKLERINTNQVNNEEEVEALVAEVVHDLHIVHRALEKVGAETDPIGELNSKVFQIKAILQGA